MLLADTQADVPCSTLDDSAVATAGMCRLAPSMCMA